MRALWLGLCLLCLVGCRHRCEDETTNCGCAARSECRLVVDTCFCPSECGAEVQCVCGGGRFLRCESR